MWAALHLLTLNIWGIPTVPFHPELAPNREDRVSKICSVLKIHANEKTLDVVALQEVWLKKDRETFKHCGFPYVTDLDESSHWIDSGLLILSRFPSESKTSRRLIYRSQGRMDRLFSDAEALVRKSAYATKITHPKLGSFWFVTTHLISNYDEPTDENKTRRESQLKQLGQWIKEITKSERVVLAGDLNLGPGQHLWDKRSELLPTLRETTHDPTRCSIRMIGIPFNEPTCRVDHFFVSHHWLMTNEELVLENVSDHKGVLDQLQTLVPTSERANLY